MITAMETGRADGGGPETMYDDSIIMEAIKYARELFKDNTDGHGIDHTLRVYQNAMIIASSEPRCDKMMVALAALLHDADDHKLFSTKDNENTVDITNLFEEAPKKVKAFIWSDMNENITPLCVAQEVEY